MGIKDDLEAAVAKIFNTRWTSREGKVVPQPEDLGLANDGVTLDATVLYADMADSTLLVDQHTPAFAAEVYKAYLTCAARIVKDNSGAITAYWNGHVLADS